MAARVYIETSVISYLTAWLSRDLIVAAQQQLTQEWWATRRSEFELYASQLVIQEAGSGDEEAALRQREVLRALHLLPVNEQAEALGCALVAESALPEAAEGALHIAVAAVHRMDYLLTWNCSGIANARVRKHVAVLCESKGYKPPVICTPEQLMGTRTTWTDPIVEEVRRGREEHAARFGYDVGKICQDLQEQQKRGGRKIVSLPPKRIEPAEPLSRAET